MKFLNYVPVIAWAKTGLTIALLKTSPSVSYPSSGSFSLKSSIEPVNQTHIKVTITNAYAQDISVLSWNSHFESRAEYRSFTITHGISGSRIVLRPGLNMLRYHYSKAVPSHFTNITAGSTYTGYFDITDLFAVPEAGLYNVMMNIGTPAFLHSNGTTLR